MFKRKKRHPQWSESPPPPHSYRSVFKYGDPLKFKHPNRQWVTMLKDELGMTDDDFQNRIHEGRNPIDLKRDLILSPEQVEKISKIVGSENATTKPYQRVKYAYGKTTEEMMELARGHVHEIADMVVHPRHKEDVREIVRYCNREQIPVHVFSGGSSVTLGLRPSRGGITLVLSTHMNRLLALNETNQTARVQPGMTGPAYEAALNRAPEKYMAEKRYTCGHFPQSFEHSTVGGWIAAMGSGQASTCYGDAADLVVSQEYVTPFGRLQDIGLPCRRHGTRFEPHHDRFRRDLRCSG